MRISHCGRESVGWIDSGLKVVKINFYFPRKNFNLFLSLVRPAAKFKMKTLAGRKSRGSA